MENARMGDRSQMRVHRSPWLKQEGEEPGDEEYTPEFPAEFEEAAKTGHGGGDFFTSMHFAQAIRSGKQPFLDVHRGVSMSIVGVRCPFVNSCALFAHVSLTFCLRFLDSSLALCAKRWHPARGPRFQRRRGSLAVPTFSAEHICNPIRFWVYL